MSLYMKRLAMPKTWPLPKKGCKYVMKPLAGKSLNFCMPATIILRELLGVAKTSKEVKQIMQDKGILVNNKVINDKAYPIAFFDIVSLPKISKFYRINLNENGRLCLEEITEKNAFKKYYKIISKTALKKNRIQINFQDGNLIAEKNFAGKVNDCVVMDTQNKKIIKILPFEEKQFVIITGGKHVGDRGIIEKIENNAITIRAESGKLKTIKKNLFICEK